MRKFSGTIALNLCNLGATLDVYETSGLETSTYYDKLGIASSSHGIAMRMTSPQDASFARQEYPSGIKAHLRFEKTEHSTQQLTPVELARGFNFT